ncbi:MAG TPA: DUF1302 family protein [Blastocatellia bacterium]|nr:DUF1302 family protein [Blastocatellia bacterium]
MLFFWLLPLLTFAQTTDPGTANASRWQWSFTLRNRTGFRLDEPRVLQMSRTMLDAKGICKLSDNWKLTLEARAHIDPVERLGYPHKVWIDPRQALLDGKAGRVDLKLGLQQIVWGQADGLRVLDVINPLDYREFILEDFIDSRRPLWAARADMPLGKGSVQFVFIPYFAPGRLPAGNDEFSLGPGFGLGLLNAARNEQSPQPQFIIRILPTERPAYRLKASQAGARYSRSVGKWDLTANYFYGWEDTPTLYLNQVQPASPLPILLFAPRYDRREVIGATATNNFGPVVLRLEAGWNRNKPVAVKSGATTGFEKHGQFSGVVGVDYSPREWLWLSGQYFLAFTSAPERNLLFPRYNHLASVYVRTNFFRDTFRPELFVLTGLNQREYLIRPRLVKTIGDHWAVGVGADFPGGRASNIFGYFDSRDRAVIELKWMK